MYLQKWKNGLMQHFNAHSYATQRNLPVAIHKHWVTYTCDDCDKSENFMMKNYFMFTVIKHYVVPVLLLQCKYVILTL